MTTHAKISYLKSALRLAGYTMAGVVFIENPWAAAAFALLFGAEVLGIVEEIGH